jgi:hypothetical protein
MAYTLAENRLDDMALTREYFIDTPNGRMSVRLPEFLTMAEHSRRLRIIVDSLNHAELQPERKGTRSYSYDHV